MRDVSRRTERDSTTLAFMVRAALVMMALVSSACTSWHSAQVSDLASQDQSDAVFVVTATNAYEIELIASDAVRVQGTALRAWRVPGNSYTVYANEAVDDLVERLSWIKRDASGETIDIKLTDIRVVRVRGVSGRKILIGVAIGVGILVVVGAAIGAAFDPVTH